MEASLEAPQVLQDPLHNWYLLLNWLFIERFSVAVIDTGIEHGLSARHLRISVGLPRFGVFQLFRLSHEQLGFCVVGLACILQLCVRFPC
ncbi:hypothetical protein B0H17DRAFT_1205652 [Mycena rosella]|uniref:Uncharacterized protein n=1 Tax=Mycena rosella TaxID=1033263 RepID=A0AAD7D7B3_MYCRO|nr:hypothetical protein B0H17DRAFT_1205652 [Mycena rosella]